MTIKLKILLLLMTTSLFNIGCLQGTSNPSQQTKNKMQENNNVINSTENTTVTETATFGTGCFWCTEAQFSSLKGVLKAVPGYSGGSTVNPSYEEVCTGNTGHAEVIQITFDPNIISFDELLEAFWIAHDPTQLNRQGNDIGTQYRSVIFYHNETQKNKAEDYKNRLNAENVFDNPIVTEISPYTEFYQAEDYHLNYYNQNPNKTYCVLVVRPKLEKFRKVFESKLKN